MPKENKRNFLFVKTGSDEKLKENYFAFAKNR